MKQIKTSKLNLLSMVMLGFLVASSALPISAQAKFKVADEVIVTFFDGRQCNAVVDGVYVYTGNIGIKYSVSYKCPDGETNTGYVLESSVRPRSGTKATMQEKVNATTSGDPTTATGVSAADLDWFFGKWKLSRYGGGSDVERGGKIYRETLMYVSKAAPITINAGGTYSWTIRDGSLLKGNWRKLKPEEDNITGGKNGLVLLNGFDGVDWQVSFMGTPNGKESIKIYSHLGNFDGERMGANKGEPEWNKVQFAKGDSVVVTIPGGAQCNGVVDKPYRDYTGTLTYFVDYTCSDGSKSSGAFPANKMSRR